MDLFTNLDLLSVGIVTAAAGILSFIIYLTDSKSVTNRSFLWFAIVTVCYSWVNYLAYRVGDVETAFWLLRLTVFTAVWHAFSIFQLFYVFPEGRKDFPRWYRFGLVPATGGVAALTLTPAIFLRIGSIGADGSIATVVNGPAFFLFGGLSAGLVVASIALLLRKTWQAAGVEKKQFRTILIGTFVTFFLLLVFNLLLPSSFDISRYTGLAPVFFMPFLLCTFYAIVRHHLLNVKVIATEILAFFLSVVTLIEVGFSRDTATLVFRLAIFLITLGFSILLIRSVRHEVEQREELQKLTNELTEKNAALDQLSKFKSQLLSLASHQIKSPLAAIKGFVSLLAQGMYGAVSEKQKETLGKVQRSADELIGLINTLLDLRKVDEGKMDYQFARTNLVPLVKEVVGGLEPLAGEKKLELSFHTALHECWISADAEKLTQVVRNLVDNSIKYTPSGYVRVTLATDPRGALVKVEDSGLGMSPGTLAVIFEEFSRDERVKKQIRGTGLGLYIAKRITEDHRGTLEASSAGEGKGSTFRLLLPLAP